MERGIGNSNGAVPHANPLPAQIPRSPFRVPRSDVPTFLLALLIAAYTVVFTGLNWYRMLALRQGFDFLVYEQPIWNTVHGRPFAQSMYSFSPTHLGVDLALFELWVAPFYALWQGQMSLFVIISFGAALGAWPLFLIARERFDSGLAGLAWAALYLLFLPVGTITLGEFQPRLFAASALLGAYWFYRRERALAFWLCLLLAITVRSDVGLVVGMFGVFGLLERRDWRFGLAPALVGFGYWIAAVFLIIPALADGHGFLWQVNYAWLGADSRAILTTILTDPLYTARGVFTLEKGRYLAQLLWPLSFLPLLRPRLLLIPAPILALNLLSGELVQFDLFHQYQALIIPFLFIAAIEGLADLLAAGGAARLRRLAVLALAGLAAAILLLPLWPGSDTSRNALHPSVDALIWPILAALVCAPIIIAALLQRGARVGPTLTTTLGGLCVLMLLQHLALGSEPQRFLKDPRPSPRLAAAREIIALVPRDAPLAVTSQLGIWTPIRRELYHFPGNSSYDPALVARARYVIGDRQRDDGREAGDIAALINSGRWRIVAEQSDFVLLEQAGR
ncbi:MAG: hypothetical protein AVDCRST_MAG18-2072 [uncultured Thermomicrobiales bacterium]|uniref:DUF2079 domain-containing protein n=1 Tax=uncultured Thermomicrobiales bacterium TaxID=1645740 RepID=A0A6J4V826_9BACT|nr:MAG: hypothetical protein AVDCRST_MAG18-2072 [uncultured Thermomicrobiales bacterium]